MRDTFKTMKGEAVGDFVLTYNPGDWVRRGWIDAECSVRLQDGGACGQRMTVRKWSHAYGTYIYCPIHGEKLLPTTAHLTLKEDQ
jgi:hypothetical protein